MRLRWLPAAAEDLAEIDAYLRRYRPLLAYRTIFTIYNGILDLRDRPYWAMEGTRELVFSPLPYLVTYRVGEHAIEILAIRHGAQEQPRP